MRFLNFASSGPLVESVDFFYQRKTPRKRIGIFISVLFLHVMVIYALATGLARKMVEVVHPPIEIKIIQEMKPMPEEVAPPQPQLQPRPRPPKRIPKPKPRPVIPPPEVVVRRPAPLPKAPAAVTNVEPPPAPEPEKETPLASVAPTPAPQVPIRTAPVVDSRFCKKPEYPSASRRFEESGTVVLNFLIDANGRVIQSKIQSSSGYQRLDEAARQALSLCRFKPGTVDGKPEQSWHKLTYVWKLEEA